MASRTLRSGPSEVDPDPGVEPVLLLHGQPGSARDWDRVRAALDGRAVTVAIDRPGWDGHNPAVGLEGNAEAALVALDGMNVPRATLVGHSLGGAVAAWLAAAHPDRVGALVLAAPSANLASLVRVDYLLAAPIAGQLASAAAFAGVGLALTARRVRRWAANALALDDGYLQAAARSLLTPSAWRSFAAEQQALIRDLPRLEGRLGRISAPTCIVSGTADRIVPISSARVLARQIPGAQLVPLEGAGHLIHQQHPDRLAEVIATVGG
jgi:pimeloyl-ACP methyl ester carboxylesterase